MGDPMDGNALPCKCGGYGVEHWPDGSTRHYIECDKCGRRTATHLASHGGSARDEWLSHATAPDELEVVAWNVAWPKLPVEPTNNIAFASEVERRGGTVEPLVTLSQAHSTIAVLRAERDELLYLHSERDQGDKIINERLAALEDGVKALVIERDSWRRVAERLEGEKQAAGGANAPS